MLLPLGGRIRVLHGFAGLDGRVTVETEELSEVITQSVILPRSGPHAEAVAEFEELLNNQHSTESDFQSLMESHPAILLGSDFEQLYPHVLLVRDGDDKLIPDFLLKPIEGMSREPRIVELKTPWVDLIKPKKRREGLYANVMDGVNQLLAYGDFFRDQRNREYVQHALGFTAYRPQLVLVAGRTPTNVSDETRARVLDSITPVQLITYEDLLISLKARADAKLD